jgi:5-methyltetrahydropteroyltriglutamate--homocysteine methyltransferase
LVQFDEPVLSEVVFTGPTQQRSFMCGALSEKGDAVTELAFARDLLNAVTHGFPRERLGLHMCRGNWTPDESTCLSGDYRPLVSTLAQINVGTYFLELCTPRAGEEEPGEPPEGELDEDDSDNPDPHAHSMSISH